MTWQLIPVTKKTRKGKRQITINIGERRGYLSRAAWLALGQPTAVQMLRDGDRIAVAAATRDDENSRALTPTGPQCGATFGSAALAEEFGLRDATVITLSEEAGMLVGRLPASAIAA